ncbi:ATP-grasp domain-containing protein [Pseudomonas sp. TH04]|uniref:ATP-grasp domain-containing protein n=1 Tax=Pseudomonas sp. TH04 TaxID=2796370 RepID=UPI0019148722|nr:ATP-grasp domain-containing protein [Pseudomonas sp. TH04]MBK5543672.1 ATP-grasp domain-containing protein [Pseudomonas sp. TH04]
MRRLIMIGGWTEIYVKAKACGFHLTVVQQKEDITFEDFLIADQIISSPMGEKVVVDLVETLHRREAYHAVVSFQEFGLLNAALIQERLGILGNPIGPVLLTRDKGHMRAHMKANGIPSIPFATVNSPEEVIAFAQQCGWPIIIKPVNGAGSLQVHKLFSEDEVVPAYNAIKQDFLTTDLIKYDFPDIGIIAEKFIEGPEVSVEAISWDGQHTILGVTDKITTGYPGFVETGHSMPSALAPEKIDAIKQLTISFLTSIGHLYGPSHSEIIFSETGPVIVESHTRTGGDRIFEMTELACGVDMFTATLQGLSGAFPDIQMTKTNGAAIRYLSLPTGRVTSISGLDTAHQSPGVVRCDITVKAGDICKRPQNSDERAGYILANGDSGPQAIENVMRALAKVTVEVERLNA